MKENTNSINLFGVIARLVGITGVSYFAGINCRRESVTHCYYLASNSRNWPNIGIKLSAIKVSIVHLLIFAQTGYNQSLLMVNYPLMYDFMLARPKLVVEQTEELHSAHLFEVLNPLGCL